MTLLGLDFDNTLVRYDRLFHILALERNLISPSVPANKTFIRDLLRSQGQEHEFTLLQGEVYGPYILNAEPSEGVLDSLKNLAAKGIDMVLVSHKTRTPYRGPKHDLRGAAMKWLKKHHFFDEKGLNWDSKKVFFEDTKEDKIKRIHSLNCTHYIDDLPEILELIDTKVQCILYSPIDNKKERSSFKTMNHWNNLEKIM